MNALDADFSLHCRWCHFQAGSAHLVALAVKHFSMGVFFNLFVSKWTGVVQAMKYINIPYIYKGGIMFY